MMCRFFLAGLIGLVVAGCSSMGGGAPAGQAQVVVTDVVRPQIETKAEEVFYSHGFQFRGAVDDHMEFERQGGMTDNILYGNWDKKDTVTRVTLYIIPKGPMTYALRTRSVILRRVFSGDEDDKMFDVQGARYKAILDKIVRELREENPPQR